MTRELRADGCALHGNSYHTRKPPNKAHFLLCGHMHQLRARSKCGMPYRNSTAVLMWARSRCDMPKWHCTALLVDMCAKQFSVTYRSGTELLRWTRPAIWYSHYLVFARIPNTKCHIFRYSQVFAPLKRPLFGLLGSLAWAWTHSWKSKSSIISKVSQINCICCFLHAKAMQIYPKMQ